VREGGLPSTHPDRSLSRCECRMNVGSELFAAQRSRQAHATCAA
jgi:hypothetical protein